MAMLNNQRVTIVISTINHRIQPLTSQLNAIARTASSCTPEPLYLHLAAPTATLGGPVKLPVLRQGPMMVFLGSGLLQGKPQRPGGKIGEGSSAWLVMDGYGENSG